MVSLRFSTSPGVNVNSVKRRTGWNLARSLGLLLNLVLLGRVLVGVRNSGVGVGDKGLVVAHVVFMLWVVVVGKGVKGRMGSTCIYTYRVC